jgi:hypothetical protein
LQHVAQVRGTDTITHDRGEPRLLEQTEFRHELSLPAFVANARHAAPMSSCNLPVTPFRALFPVKLRGLGRHSFLNPL